VILKKATEGPSAGDGQMVKGRRALIKAVEIPMLIPSPTSGEVHGTRKAAKTIKAPNFAVRNSFAAYYTSMASQT
jgi:hypothetical protein